MVKSHPVTDILETRKKDNYNNLLYLSKVSFKLISFYYFVANRLGNFVVGLTNNNPSTTAPVYKSSYTLCAQYSGSLAPSDSATVDCASSTQNFRYVIIQGSHSTAKAICLTEVAVYISIPGRKYQ